VLGFDISDNPYSKNKEVIININTDQNIDTDVFLKNLYFSDIVLFFLIIINYFKTANHRFSLYHQHYLLFYDRFRHQVIVNLKQVF